MRLYLSSYGLGNNPIKLLEMVGQNKRVAVIVNAHDYKTDAERQEKVTAEMKSLKEIGLDPFEIDLRDYFNNPISLSDLNSCGLIWVRGGNVFVLLLAMKLSRFDVLLIENLKNDTLVYGGYSAGGCVLSPSMIAYDIVDDPTLTKKAYGLEPIYEGLKVLDYHFEPHYKSDHPESADVYKEIEKLQKLGLPYKTLRDGEVLVVENEHEEIIS